VFRESLAVFLGCDGIGLSCNKIFWASLKRDLRVRVGVRVRNSGSSNFLMGESSLLVIGIAIAVGHSNHRIKFDTDADADCDTDNKDQYSHINYSFTRTRKSPRHNQGHRFCGGPLFLNNSIFVSPKHGVFFSNAVMHIVQLNKKYDMVLLIT